MNRPRFYQRQFFIKKEFQSKFILLYFLCVSAVVGVVTYFLFLQIEQAVEKHLYSTHMKIDRVGDFLRDLLFNANFSAILAIIVSVLLLSLLVFQRINKDFRKIDARILSMSRGDFSGSARSANNFFRVGELSEALERVQQNYSERYEQLSAALDDLEEGILDNGDKKLIKAGMARLESALKDISFIEK